MNGSKRGQEGSIAQKKLRLPPLGMAVLTLLSVVAFVPLILFGGCFSSPILPGGAVSSSPQKCIEFVEDFVIDFPRVVTTGHGQQWVYFCPIPCQCYNHQDQVSVYVCVRVSVCACVCHGKWCQGVFVCMRGYVRFPKT